MQVEIKNVGKEFAAGIWGIRNVSIGVEKGELVSLVGPSGCGKTTTLRVLAGLEMNSEGTVSIGSRVVSDPKNHVYVPPEKRNMGMVFQSYAVWPHMNVFDNIAYPLKIKKVALNEMQSRVAEVIEAVGLKGMESRRPSALSGGQQQRVALARGLVMRPDVLLMDEPLSNLDTQLRAKMRVDIKALQKKFSLSVVYVTHDRAEAEFLSDKIVVMNKGEIVQQGSYSEIMKNPVNQFVIDFFKSH